MNYSYSFKFLWLGQSLANLADSFYMLAIVTLIYGKTGSAAISAFIPVIRIIAKFISGIISPLLLERYRLLPLLITSQGSQTLLLGLLILSIDWWKDSASLTLVIWLFIILLAFFDGWTNPARNSLVPRLVTKEQLVKANGLLSTSDQTVLLVGWGAGGLLVELLGAHQVLWLTAVCFLISTLSLFFIHDPHHKERVSAEKTSHRKAMKEGWQLLFNHPVLKRLAAIDFLDYTASSVWIGAITLTFVDKVLHEQHTWWGFINSSYFLGTMIGGMLVIRYSHSIEKRLYKILIFSGFASILFKLIFGFVTFPVISLITIFLLGFPYQAKGVAKKTLYQLHTTLDTMPKVFSAQYALCCVAYGTSCFLMGWVADHFSVQWVYIIAAVASTVATFVSYPLKKFEARTIPVRSQSMP
ncbi:MFS transporter [Thermoactinomyces sp. CICC 24226]|jgi:MFS family permease|uniref:MFS transporter n=1 Tax=Thermoactinomyces sp. CICC 24226 TaxID=2767431 RepID=UPI0018DD3909|nr:MFS transporter [Thermoactinomyces sp. CICC 24226]MBI0391490.1 MFS transporter [Thermoactinomyces sp. CICC 24226]